MTLGPGDELKVYVQVPGVVVPGWLAMVVAAALLFSALGFLLSVFLIYDARADTIAIQNELGAVRELKTEVESLRRQLSSVSARQEMLQLDFHDVEVGLVNRGHLEPEDLTK